MPMQRCRARTARRAPDGPHGMARDRRSASGGLRGCGARAEVRTRTRRTWCRAAPCRRRGHDRAGCGVGRAEPKRWPIVAAIAGLIIAAGIAAVMWSSPSPHRPCRSHRAGDYTAAAPTPQPAVVAAPAAVPVPPVADAKPSAAEGKPAVREVAPAWAVTAENRRRSSSLRPPPIAPGDDAQATAAEAADRPKRARRNPVLRSPLSRAPERRTEPRSEPRMAEPRSGGADREAECARLFARLLARREQPGSHRSREDLALPLIDPRKSGLTRRRAAETLAV